jgi:hypothetical protein
MKPLLAKLDTVQLARFTLGFSWIYHGLFPKLLHIAPLEMQMSSSIGLSETYTVLFIRAAGVSEIVFGLLLIWFYRSSTLLLLNTIALLALLIFVIVLTPALVVEAFNPVTTNLPLIVLGLVLLRHSHTQIDNYNHNHNHNHSSQEVN